MALPNRHKSQAYPFHCVLFHKELKIMTLKYAIVVWFLTVAAAFAEPLTLPLDARPEWVSREGIVFAWSMEPLLFRGRRDGADDYNPTPEQRAAYEREYSPEMINRLKRLGVNLVMTHCYKGAGLKAERQSMAEAVEYAQRIRDAGLHVAVYNYSGAFIWELLFQEMPQARQWVLWDAAGKPIPYGSATWRYYWNRNHPEAIAFYRDIVRFAVEEVKPDLIHFDNYQLGPGTDPVSVARFRDYLRTHFSPERLAASGVNDIDQVRPPLSGAPTNLLRRAWLKFTCESLTDSYHDMVAHARSLRKDILIQCNPHGIVERIRPPIDHFRLIQAGEAFWHERMGVGYHGGALCTRIRTYKVARRMDNIAFTYTTNPLEWSEAMAFNLDCVGAILEFEYGDVHDRRNRPVTEMSPYIRFFRQRRDLLRDASVVADVAVLRSFPSQVFADPKYASTTYLAEKELIHNRACFQIINDDLLDELDRYRVLVLAGCLAMSDEHAEAIRRFVNAGGKVCVSGPLATHDDWMEARDRPALENLPEDRVIQYDRPSHLMDALEKALDGKPSLRITAAREAVTSPPKLTPGHRFYTDRDYALVDAPKELLGAATARFSATASKRDSSLDLDIKAPATVFVAFAPHEAETRWLKPQPGWKLYKKDALKTTLPSFGTVMDIHCMDVPAGKFTLFDGKQGDYLLVAVKPRDDNGPKPVFTMPPRSKGAPLGLCAELTQQARRRLVHLVNYRDDGPIKTIDVEVRLPDKRKAKSVVLSSPERADDMAVPFTQKGPVVRFTVPEIKVYEIAAVAME